MTDCFWARLRKNGNPIGKLHAARTDRVTAWCGLKRRGVALNGLPFNPAHPDACRLCVRAIAKECGAG